MQILTI
jgi:dynein heavy chain